MAGWQIILALALGIALLLGLRGILRSASRHGPRRGVAPGQGAPPLHASLSPDGPDRSRSWTVPQDPQAYAKTFVPARARREDRT